MTVAPIRLANMGVAHGHVCLECAAILQAMHGSAKALSAADVQDRLRTRVCSSLSQRDSVSKLRWAKADEQAVVTAPVCLQEEQPYATVPNAPHKLSDSFIESSEHVSYTRVK